MTDNITLPRVVVLQIREALMVAATPIPADRHTVKAALGALDAALAEPPAKPEPVAWLRKDGLRFRGDIEPQDGSELPLYAAPPAAAKPEPYTLAELFARFAAKQKPLDADMAAIINANLDSLYITDEPAAAKREPAKVEQIDEEYIGPVIDARWHDFEAGFRAAERFHGIGGSK